MKEKTPPHSWMEFSKAVNPSEDTKRGCSLEALLHHRSDPVAVLTLKAVPHDRWQLQQLLSWKINGEELSLFFICLDCKLAAANKQREPATFWRLKFRNLCATASAVANTYHG